MKDSTFYEKTEIPKLSYEIKQKKKTTPCQENCLKTRIPMKVEHREMERHQKRKASLGE